MPALNLYFLQFLADDYKRYPTFVETGTLTGASVLAVEPGFQSLYTIEISEKYFKLFQAHNTSPKITPLLGDSSDILGPLCQKIDTNTIFWLDGHYSAGDTGRGAKDCPLYEEITAIAKNFRHKGIIIIDDHRLFGKVAAIDPNKPDPMDQDWSGINDAVILHILGSRAEKIYYLPSDMHPSDRMIIHLREGCNY